MAASDVTPTQQGLRQASVRAVTGTTGTVEGDWEALFDAASIPAGPFNGRMLAWINLKLSKAYTEVNGALQALAEASLAINFSSLGTFDASTGGVNRNAQLVLNKAVKTGFTFWIRLY